MKSKQIVYTLGYITLFCVALYFVFGILKLSGQGLSSMGFDGNIVEGMKNKKEQEKELGKQRPPKERAMRYARTI